MATTIGQYPVKTPSGIILLPVVAVGDSILPSKCRVRVAGKTGELSLVYPGDIRASQIAISQGGANFRVAKDPRTEIGYSPGTTYSHNTEGGSWSRSWTIGPTYFNRVTRIEATLRVGTRWRCRNFSLTSPYHSSRCSGWISVSGTTSAESSRVSASHGENHDVANADFYSSWSYTTGTVALDLPPGSYTITLGMQLEVVQRSGHNAITVYGSIQLQSWKEIARG